MRSAQRLARTFVLIGVLVSGSALGSSLPVHADNNLPTPAWWNGDCDSGGYVGAYRLGAVYRGMPACGPSPFVGHGTDRFIQFFPTAHGEFEWECVELSMRFMYLAYGIQPYGANGSQVVWNYQGSALTQVYNPTSGQAPSPGDVLSYGATTGNGHTSVVTASSVNGSGNGSISVIEQNNSSGGAGSMSVSNWKVNSNIGYPVTGWLHNGTPPPPPTDSGLATSMVYDSVGGSHAAAQGPNHSLIYYHKPPGAPATGPWAVQHIDDNPTTFSAPSIAIAPDGSLHIAAEGASRSLKYYYIPNGGSSWSGYQVDNNPTTFSTPSIAVESNGTAHIAVEGPNHSLKHYYGSFGAWNGQNVDNSANTFAPPSLVLGSDGSEKIAVQGASNTLWYYWAARAGQFNSMAVNLNPQTFSAPSMAIDATGTLHIAAQGPTHTLSHYWIAAGGTSWNGEQVDSHANTYAPPSLVLGSDGSKKIAVEGANNSLWFYWAGASSPGGWNSGLVDQPGRTYSAPSMAIGSDQVLHMAAEGLDNSQNGYYVNSGWWANWGQVSGTGQTFTSPE
jgi:hypothetical protein